MARVPVHIAPHGTTVWVETGSPLLDATRAAGVVVPAPCGGRGVCGSCGVRVVAGALAEPDAAERLGLRRAPEGVRLACRARVEGAVTVRPVISYGSAHADANLVDAAAAHPTGSARTALVAGVDLGTTSVAAAIVDAETGCELARASVPNGQQRYGADVLSRVSAALSGAAGELRALAEESVAEAVVLACSSAHVPTDGIATVVVAANSAMAALFAGSDVSSLASHPFSPPFGGGGVEVGPVLRALVGDARFQVIAPMGAFVGGDAVAAVAAVGLLGGELPALLVDVGTNAEIVLATSTGTFAASAAAGPAFEGAGIACGGPAADGAVQRVTVDGGEVRMRAIGEVEPRWFSGAGLVSALAALRRAGHVDADGALSEAGPLGGRFSRDHSGVLQVDFSTGSDAGTCLTLSQLDIRTLQLAKGAIRAGIEAVLARAGVRACDLARVAVAGAFGAALATDDLAEMGVIPAEAACVTSAVGNAALDGAVMAALAAEEGEHRAGGASAEVLDLVSDPGFAQLLMGALRLERY